MNLKMHDNKSELKKQLCSNTKKGAGYTVEMKKFVL